MLKSILQIIFLLISISINAQKKSIEDIRQNFDINQALNDLNFFKENLSDKDNENSSVTNNYEPNNSVISNEKVNGNISLGYSYGLNTLFTDIHNGISSTINSSGELKTSLLKLPVIFSYNYSTMKLPLGANNYFRISFDKQKYLDNQTSILDAKLMNVGSVEEKLKKSKSELSNIQGQTEVYLDMLKRKLVQEARLLMIAQQNSFKDSLNNSDSSKKMRSGKKADSLQFKILKNKEEYEKTAQDYQQILAVQKSYDSLIKKYKFYRESLNINKEKISNNEIQNHNSFSKVGFVKSIQKIDLGLTYPRTTGLSNQTTAIKGVGTEFQFNNYYLAFSSGLTINNIMMSTNEITNQLEYNQNVFNQFDFQQVKDNGLLTNIKTGWGTPDNNHAFVGFNYLTNTRLFNSMNNSESNYDPAASVELDLRYIPTLYEGGTLDLIYGKTSSNNKIDSTQREVFGSLFSNYNSNVLMLNYSQNVTKIKSDFSVQYRLIDPNANTSVYGMLQPGNKRISFTTKHRISPFLNVGTNHKLDESYGTKNKILLKSTGANISGKITDYLFYSTMINYVEFATISEKGNKTSGASYLAGVSLQSLYKFKHLKGGIAINYNDYLFSDTSSAVKYTQIGVSKMLGNKKWSVSLNYDYFFQNSGGLEKGSNVYGINGKYNLKRIQFNSGLNLLVDNELKKSLGGHVEVKYSITQRIDLNIRAERFVLGNFYTSYYRKLYEQLPYLFSFKMNFKL